MASIYIYALSGGIRLKVTDSIGPLNEWEEVGNSGKLIITSGLLKTGCVPPKVCTSAPLSNPHEVVTLHDASWASEVGNTGAATVHLGTGTPGSQTWTLEQKS